MEEETILRKQLSEILIARKQEPTAEFTELTTIVEQTTAAMRVRTATQGL